jgi:hypothetical protein
MDLADAISIVLERESPNKHFCNRVELRMVDGAPREALSAWLLAIADAVAASGARLEGIKAKSKGNYPGRGTMKITLDFYCARPRLRVMPSLTTP